MSTPENCLHCGVCCFSSLERYVSVDGRDWARLGPAADRLAHFIGHRAFMRMEQGHCAALSVRREAEGTPLFFCTVYEQRPQVCRDLQRGSPACEGERALKAPRVAAAVSTG